MKLIANVSTLFTEYPLAERLVPARKAGFDGVEIQFINDADIEALQAAMSESGLGITLINVPRGPGDAVGLAALPGLEGAFRDAVRICGSHVQALDVGKVNVLSGSPVGGADPEACTATLVRNLRFAADVMQDHGVRVMVEPVNPHDVPGFFLSDLASALDVLDRADHPNLALQFDLYHMARTEADLIEAIRQAGSRIGHVQFADTHGRHEPGTGDIDFAAALAALRETGYDDAISAEYTPRDGTAAGLDWIPDFRKHIA